MSNFDELLPKVSTWTVEEEEILINKIKQMTEDYQQKCSDLSINLNNMTRNLHLIEVDFFNALNGLKIVSGQKFIEHLIDTEDIKPEEERGSKNCRFLLRGIRVYFTWMTIYSKKDLGLFQIQYKQKLLVS